MPWLSGIAADQRPGIGADLVRCLTLDTADLATYLVDLSPARAENLIAQATRHGVGPLLRHRLIQQGLFSALPAAARDDLDTQYVNGSACTLVRHYELGVILDRLAVAGIPVIALKGLYLANAVYPEPGLRPMSDMDLLFREEDLAAVHALLFQLGYTRAERARPVADFLTLSHQLPVFERAGATRIEAHMDLESPDAPFSIDLAGVWRRARPWSLNGRQLLALSPEDLLLHLCLHSMYHHKFRIGLNALADIGRVIPQEAIDWDRVVERARGWRAEAPTFLGLALAHRLIAAAVPASVLAALSPGAGSEEALRLAEQTLLAERPQSRQDDALRAWRQRLAFNYLRQLNTLRDLPGGRSKLRYLLWKAFPSRASLAHQYPRLSGSAWLRAMYLVHWLVLTGRLLRAVSLPGWRQGRVLRKVDERWFS